MQKSRRRFITHGMLSQLTAFEAVARLGSYTLAAKEMHLTQPTVSVQIKKLTQALGMPVFEQIGKRVHLTAAGQELYAACAEIFRTLDNVEEKLGGMRDLRSGSLRLATSASGRYFSTGMLADFLQHYPGIDIALHVHHRQNLLERLAGNVDDLYILSNPPDGDNIVKQVIFANPLMVFARADHPLAKSGRIPFERLANEPFLMREAGSGTRMVVEQTFAQHGMKPWVRMELGNDDAIKHAIAAGLGVSILSRYAWAQDSRDDGIVALDVVGFPLLRQWYFVYPSGKRPSLTTQCFIDFVRNKASTYEQTDSVTPRQRAPRKRAR